MIEQILKRYKPELSSDWMSFFFANVNEKGILEFTFDVFWNIEADNVVNGFNFVDSSTLDISESFTSYKFGIGDTFTIVDPGNPNNGVTGTILRFSANNTKLHTTAAVFTTESDNTTAVIHGTTPIKTVEFFSTFVENSDPFEIGSLWDEVPAKWGNANNDYFTGTPTTKNLVEKGNYKSAFIDSSYVPSCKYVGTSNYRQQFIITFPFILAGWYLSGQLQDSIDNLPPDYFDGDKCLKHTFQVNAKVRQNDPTGIHSITVGGDEDTEVGNTGYEDEKGNQGENEFALENITYTDLLTSVEVDSLQLDRATIVRIDISTTGTAFLVGSTKYCVNFLWCNDDNTPGGEDSYVKNSRYWAENFLFDRIVQDLGDTFGFGDFNIVSLVDSTIDGANMRISFFIQFSEAEQEKITTEGFYKIGVAVEDYTLTSETSNKVLLRCAVDQVTTDLRIQDAMNCDSLKFYNAGVAIDGAIKYGSFDGGLQRLYTSVADFYIDISDTTRRIEKTVVKLEAINKSNGDRIILETREFETSIYKVVDNVQQININDTRGFAVKSGDKLDTISYTRNTGLDSGTKKYFRLKYAFRLNWQDWLALIIDSGVDVSEIYDSGKLLNGLNNRWSNYITSNFEIKQTITNYLNVTDNSLNDTSYQILSPACTVRDFDTERVGTITAKHYTYSADGATELSNSDDNTQLIIKKNEDVMYKVVITFDDVNLIPPILGDLIPCVMIDEYQGGSLSRLYSDSSLNKTTDNSLKPITGESALKVERDLSGKTITLSCLVDYTKINTTLDNFTFSFDLQSKVLYNILLPSGYPQLNGAKTDYIKLSASPTGGIPIISDGSDFDYHIQMPDRAKEYFSWLCSQYEAKAIRIRDYSAPDDRSFVNPSGCSGGIDVFAQDSADPNYKSYKNDYHTFYYELPIDTDTITLTLQKEGIDVSAITDDTYGTYYAAGTIDDYPLYVIFKMDFYKIYNSLGAGSYNLKVERTEFGVSETAITESCFNVRLFNWKLANETVRIDVVLNNNLTNTFNFLGLNLENSLRLPGFFEKIEPDFERDNIKYANDEFEQIRDEKINKYKLFIYPIEECKMEMIKDVFLLANEIKISDFNRDNYNYELNEVAVLPDELNSLVSHHLARKQSMEYTFKIRKQNDYAENCN